MLSIDSAVYSIVRTTIEQARHIKRLRQSFDKSIPLPEMSRPTMRGGF